LIALTNQEGLSRTGGYRDSRFDFIILFFFICSYDKANPQKSSPLYPQILAGLEEFKREG
jgi:hypothetical protein